MFVSQVHTPEAIIFEISVMANFKRQSTEYEMDGKWQCSSSISDTHSEFNALYVLYTQNSASRAG